MDHGGGRLGFGIFTGRELARGADAPLIVGVIGRGEVGAETQQQRDAGVTETWHGRRLP